MSKTQLEKRRAIRTRTTLVAWADYGLNLCVLFLFYFVGHITFDVVLTIAVISISLSILFLYLIASGKSERFNDPSLTGVQITAGCGINLLSIALAPHIIYVFVISLFVPLAYGSLHFRRGEFVLSWVLVTIALATLVIVFQDRITIDLSNPSDKFLFTFVTTISIGRFLFINAEVSNIRQRLLKKNKALRKAFGEYTDITQKDPLTGVADRGAYFRRLHELSQPIIERKAFHVAVVDIDQLQKINQLFERATGDRVIRGLSDILTCRLRRGDYVARIDGGTFGLILMESSYAEIAKIFLRIRQQVQDFHWHCDNQAYDISISIGVTTWQPGKDAMDTFTEAKTMLAAAKRQGNHQTLRMASSETGPDHEQRDAVAAAPF